LGKYTKKKQGLTVAYDGPFFFRDALGFHQDFKSMLIFERYYFDRGTVLTVDIEPPAVQLCWDVRWVPIPELKEELIPNVFHYRRDRVKIYEPKPWFADYLNIVAPGWAVRPNPLHDYRGGSLSVFLEKRKHAIIIADRIAFLLEGIKTGLT